MKMLVNEANFSQDPSPWKSDSTMASNKINRFYQINTNEIQGELSHKKVKNIFMQENKKGYFHEKRSPLP